MKESARNKLRKMEDEQKAWADFLAKIDKQADSPVFQACFGAFRKSSASKNKSTKRGRDDV